MPVNKVVYGEETLIDLTDDTVAADKLLSRATPPTLRTGRPSRGRRRCWIPRMQTPLPRIL